MSDREPSTKTRKLRQLAAWYGAFAGRAANLTKRGFACTRGEALDAEASWVEQGALFSG